MGILRHARISHTVGFGRTRPTVESGSPLEVDQIFRKIFIWTEAFYITTEISKHFGITVSTPKSPDMEVPHPLPSNPMTYYYFVLKPAIA